MGLILSQADGDLVDTIGDTRFIHHDVLKKRADPVYGTDAIYVVTAKEVMFGTSPAIPYVDDGIMVFDANNGQLLEDWQLSDILTPF